MFLAPFVLLIVFTVLCLALAERDHKRRRRLYDLPDQPSDYALFLDAQRQARIRTEARMGLSDSPLQRQRGA